MSKHIDLTLALNKLWRLCEEDIDAEIPEAFDFSRAREALSKLPTIEVGEYADKEEAFMKGYAKGCIEGYFKGIASVGEKTEEE